MKLVIGFGGILTTLDRAAARAQGYVGANFKNTPRSEEAFVALGMYRHCHGPHSLVLVTRCKDEETEREVREWLAHNHAYERLGLTEENVKICRDKAERPKIVAEIGATHILDDDPARLAEMPPSVYRLLLGQPGDHTAGGLIVLGSGWNSLWSFFDSPFDDD